MCNNAEEIINLLTPTEQKNIGEILRNLEKENKKNIEKIIRCINNCSSPQELTEKHLTQIQTIFNAFNLFPISETKVLIIGQDPYPETQKACGLSFLHQTEYPKIDATLKNILKAISDSNTMESSQNYDKTKYLEWTANNKVLLLNTALTHENDKEKTIKEHKEAWNKFVSLIIEKLFENREYNPLVIILWGKYANLMDKFKDSQKDKENKNILILRSSHPSDRGKNYCGNYQCNSLDIIPAFVCEGKYIFERGNDFLGKEAICWKDLIKIYSE